MGSFFLCKIRGKPGFDPGNYLRIDLMILMGAQNNYLGSEKAGAYIKSIKLNEIGKTL